MAAAAMRSGRASVLSISATSQAAMPFDDYLGEAVLSPLGMTTTALHGSAAHGITSTLAGPDRRQNG